MCLLHRFEGIRHIEVRTFLLIVLVSAIGAAFVQIYVLPLSKKISPQLATTDTIALVESNITLYRLGNQTLTFTRIENYTNASDSKDNDGYDEVSSAANGKYTTFLDADGDDGDNNRPHHRPSNDLQQRNEENYQKHFLLDNDVDPSGSSAQVNPTVADESQTRSFYKTNNGLAAASNTSLSASRISYFKHRRKERVMSLAQIDQLFVQNRASSHSPRPQWSSPRDREILSAKLEILNAPVLRDTPILYASIFRNISMFKRSYELMERMLKVYIYKEGEKPIFHSPITRGIYASEGWFMKLMESNRKFVVRDPRKAHLFYLPFSIKSLRMALGGKGFQSPKDLERFLKRYVNTISRKYKFWNRTSGADHFLVACHDWGTKLTRMHMKNCVRSLCNSNAAQRFDIGKDTALPVTYIRSTESPLEFLGGKPPSMRKFLAFFAGSMHGYLRPVLLEYWANRDPDMKIFGPMPRDPEGKKQYREYMKNSRYCICARGYEVHTPRVVEAIMQECIPVIISDNYVPPFFEVMNWEAFSVFVEEKDVPNLKDILMSIPDERYLVMHARVRMVQRHFSWHKKPEKYDLFHMVLHAIWYNRVFQIKPR